MLCSSAAPLPTTPVAISSVAARSSSASKHRVPQPYGFRDVALVAQGISLAIFSERCLMARSHIVRISALPG